MRAHAIETVSADFDPTDGDYGKGRRCPCGTWISRWNPHRRCWLCHNAGHRVQRPVPADVPLSRFVERSQPRRANRVRKLQPRAGDSVRTRPQRQQGSEAA